MAHSTPAARREHPLTLHRPTGQYRKRFRGKDHYFGRDLAEALKRFEHAWPFIQRGEPVPPFDGTACTLEELCNLFLADKDSKRRAGEITARTFEEYRKAAQALCDALGKTTHVQTISPTQLLAYRRKLQTRLGSVALGNEVQRVRSLLAFAFENALIDKPVRFGEFRKPQKRVVRREKAQKGSRLIDPADLRSLISEADTQLRAMILLALNGGLGNSDCGLLRWECLDLENGWLEYPRPKTGIPRRIPLWLETVDALRAVRDQRPDDAYVFRTTHGNRWYDDKSDKPQSAISAEFRKLAKRVGIYREGVSFYSLRHCFATIGEESGDHIATSALLGHADGSIASHYRERMSDERLRRVVDHVRGWLMEGSERE